jgi:hypothetical protein
MIESLKVPSCVINFNILSSSSKTLQFVILSGTKGLKINSTKNLSGENYVEGINHEATLARKSTSMFNARGTNIILKA